MRFARFGNRGQLKIQQMAFMLVALFIFFALATIFFIQIRYSHLKQSVNEIKKQEILSLMEVVSNMPELSCKEGINFCIDEYKLKAWDNNYSNFFPIDSLKVYKVFPKQSKWIKCPAPNCNYYELMGSKRNSKEFGAYVSLCKKLREKNYVYDKCEIAKLVIGMKNGE